MSWPLNQPVRLTFSTYSDANRTVLADATTVVLSLKAPDGTISTPAVAHDSTGTYHYDPPNTTAGLYAYQWTATGAVTTSTRSGAFSVDEQFPPMLVGLEDAKAHLVPLDVTDDDELHGFILAASALLLSHPDYRVGDACQANTYTEWHDGARWPMRYAPGDPTSQLVLKHHPVNPASLVITEYLGGVSQVIAYEPTDGSGFTGYGFTVEDGTGENGILIRTNGGYPVPWVGRVKVVYTAGSVSVPSDVRLAVLDLVQFWWSQAKGAGTQTYGQPDFGMPSPFGIPNAVTDKLVNYKRGAQVA